MRPLPKIALRLRSPKDWDCVQVLPPSSVASFWPLLLPLVMCMDTCSLNFYRLSILLPESCSARDWEWLRGCVWWSFLAAGLRKGLGFYFGGDAILYVYYYPGDKANVGVGGMDIENG